MKQLHISETYPAGFCLSTGLCRVALACRNLRFFNDLRFGMVDCESIGGTLRRLESTPAHYSLVKFLDRPA